MPLVVKVEDPRAIIPKKAYPGDAGYDLFPLESFTIAPGARATINTGLIIAITPGYYGRISSRSSNSKRGVEVVAGTVDAGYRGLVHVVLQNNSSEHQVFSDDQAMAQIVITKIEEDDGVVVVDELPPTKRGEQGFGSSNTKKQKIEVQK